MRVCGVLLLCAAFATAEITEQKSNTQENLRGVSAVSSSVVWASGTHGTFLRTTDGGSNWQVGHVPGAESLDFRDVEAFSADLAYLLAAGPGEQSRIYKTSDGGKNWALQFTNKDPKGFFDCVAFWDRDHGIAVGDPVDGKFQLIKTENGGKEWKPIPPEKLPPAMEGEGAFAASGTCIAVQGKKNVWFVTGGSAARVFRSADGGESWTVAETPIVHGPASAGIFSVAFSDAKHGVIAGGDYKEPDSPGANLALTMDGGATWKLAPVVGRNSFYFSAGAFKTDESLVLVGTAGIVRSQQGHVWLSDRRLGFNAVAVNKKSVFAVGSGGRIAALEDGFNDGPGPLTVLTDTHGVDLSAFLSEVAGRVRANWYHNVPQSARRPLRKSGTAIVEFAIERDGSVTSIHVVQSTKDLQMDEAAVVGITRSAPMPAFPTAFDQKRLHLRFRFLYNEPAMDDQRR